METINKLLKKQAPKVQRKAANAEATNEASQGTEVVFIRWVSNKDGVRVAAKQEVLESPAGKVFGGPKPGSQKMVEEVA